MKSAGIIGGSGFVAGELIRLLLHHPLVELVYIVSDSHKGMPVDTVHKDLKGDCFLNFTGKITTRTDVVFLCKGHGKSKDFLESHPISEDTLVIDLSSDFRLNPDEHDFVYGLTELNREKLKMAKRIANPGCFATAIELALLPLVTNQMIKHDIHLQGITGSTGAGHKLSETTHFSWRSNNISIYKAFNHQHLDEVKLCLKTVWKSFNQQLHFLPLRGNFTRGIFLSAYTKCETPISQLKSMYSSFYEDAGFVHLCDENISLKEVVNTNKCLLHLVKEGDKILVISVIDNLLKGAAGQALQNMNIVFGFEEKTGLQLKAMVY